MLLEFTPMPSPFPQILPTLKISGGKAVCLLFGAFTAYSALSASICLFDVGQRLSSAYLPFHHHLYQR